MIALHDDCAAIDVEKKTRNSSTAMFFSVKRRGEKTTFKANVGAGLRTLAGVPYDGWSGPPKEPCISSTN